MDISAISNMNKSTMEERQANLNYLRGLYFLYSIHLIIAWGWSLWCLSNENVSAFVLSHWGIALASAIVAILVLLICMILPASRTSPLNWIFWLIFSVSFAYTAGYLCTIDNTWLAFYSLSLLSVIAVAFCFYALFSQDYLQSLSAILFIMACCIGVFVLFIIFSDLSFIGMLFCTIICVIFGFYLNFDIRRMVSHHTHPSKVRGAVFSSWQEDPVSGAVRIWGEVGMVFCRLIELIGGMFHKGRH